MIHIGQLTWFTNLGIDICLFFIRKMEILNSRSCTDAHLFYYFIHILFFRSYYFYFVQLGRFRSLVMKSQTIFVCAFLLSTLVIFTLLLWVMTTTGTSPMVYFLVLLLSKPVIDLVYSSADYTDKVNFSAFLVQFSRLKK